ncbi:MAG TPA: type II secretion system F family protein [Verrucomicrobiales bacterium]|nr:type II secretion system F family protein [Verrucomicrobiales bacterium]
MPHFSFHALAATGEQITGTLEAPTRRDAYRQIESRALSPIEVTEKDSAAKTTRAAADGGPVIRLKRTRLIFFTTELADLIDAGLPVQQALNVMAEKQQDPIIRETGARLRYYLRDGQTLSACFRQTSSSFDDLYVSLIAAGEASGTLAGVLHRMAHSMTQIHELQRRFVGAMIYPAFMIGACALLMAVFTLVLVPQLTGLLAKTGQDLPAVTKLLLDFSHFCTANFWTMLIGGASFILLFRLLIATKGGRLWWDRAKMRIPLIGPIIETRFYAGFTQSLGNLVTNAVPLLSSLTLLVRGTPNRFFRQRLSHVIDAVSAGDPLSTSLRRAGHFQPLMTDIIAVGEQTGQLAKSLQKAATRYDKELDVRIKRLTALISPAIIIFLAAVVTVIAYCIVSSIFSAVSGIRAQTG